MDDCIPLRKKIIARCEDTESLSGPDLRLFRSYIQSAEFKQYKADLCHQLERSANDDILDLLRDLESNSLDCY